MPVSVIATFFWSHFCRQLFRRFLVPVPALGRLPDADKGTIGGTIQHIRDIFGRMGFNDREMVALIGAHAVGRCHTEASGKQHSCSAFSHVSVPLDEESTCFMKSYKLRSTRDRSIISQQHAQLTKMSVDEILDSFLFLLLIFSCRWELAPMDTCNCRPLVCVLLALENLENRMC